MRDLLFNMNKALIYAFLYISFAICLDRSTISGYVYNLEGKPLYNAEVYIEELLIGSATDSLGYFQITSPSLLKKEKKYILIVSHIGYFERKINLDDIDKNLNIYLENKSLSSDQVVVSALGYKTYIKDTPVITHVITNKEIEESPYNSIRDVIEFVMPNVQRIHDPHGNDRVKIQGLDNKFVIFMVDGNRVSGEFAGNIDLSMLSLSDIERIEIIRSGMSTLYGSDSMGGLINIITKKNKKPLSFNASYLYDLPTNQSLSLNLGIKLVSNLNFKINVDYNESPGYDLTTYDSSFFPKTLEENMNHKIKQSLSYDNGFLSIDYVNQRYVKKIKFYREIFNGSTMSYDTTLAQQNPHYKDMMNAFNISYKINDKSNLEIKMLSEVYDKSFFYPYYYNAYPNNVDGGETVLSSSPKRYDYSLILNSYYNNHLFSIGIEYAKETYQSFDIYSFDGELLEEESIFTNEDEKKIDEISIFLIDKFNFFKREIVFGIRSTKYGIDNWNFIPSFSLRQNLYNYNVRLNYSRGYRIPSLKELYYDYEGHNPPLYGNSSLKPSISNYYAVSIEHRKLSNSSMEIYFNDVTNMISTIYNSDGMYYANNDKINLYGFNISFQKEFFKRLDFSSVYSYTDAISDDKQLEEGISNHTFNFRVKYKIFKQFSLLFLSKYHSDKNVFVYDTGESKTLSSYAISNILLSFKWKKIVIKSGFKNIFNYLDPERLNSDSKELLTTTDPGRRFYFNIVFSL